MLATLKTVLAWLFAATAVYFLFRAIAIDSRLWGKRRGGAARWHVWLPPARSRNFSEDEDPGAHARRSAGRAVGYAVLFGLLALALSSL